jgi:hypothetical protein
MSNMSHRSLQGNLLRLAAVVLSAALVACSLPTANLTGTRPIPPQIKESQVLQRKMGDVQVVSALHDGGLLEVSLTADTMCQYYTVRHIVHRVRQEYRVGRTKWGFHTPFSKTMDWVGDRSLGVQVLLIYPVFLPAATLALAMVPLNIAVGILGYPVALVRARDRIKTVDKTREKVLASERDCGKGPVQRQLLELQAGGGASSFFVIDSLRGSTDRDGKAVFFLRDVEGFRGSRQPPQMLLVIDPGHEAAEAHALPLSEGEIRRIMQTWNHTGAEQ